MLIAKAEGYALALVGMLLLAAAAWFYAKHDGVMEERARWEAKAAAATKADLNELRDGVVAGNKIAADTQALLAKRKTDSIIDRGVIEREIKTNTVYAADCFPADGIRLWNALSAGRPLMSSGGAGAEPNLRMPDGNGPTGLGLERRNAATQSPGSKANIQ